LAGNLRGRERRPARPDASAGEAFSRSAELSLDDNPSALRFFALGE
jgi:hypothetical protein